jgi:hypothetical protein
MDNDIGHCYLAVTYMPDAGRSATPTLPPCPHTQEGILPQSNCYYCLVGGFESIALRTNLHLVFVICRVSDVTLSNVNWADILGCQLFLF